MAIFAGPKLPAAVFLVRAADEPGNSAPSSTHANARTCCSSPRAESTSRCCCLAGLARVRLPSPSSGTMCACGEEGVADSWAVCATWHAAATAAPHRSQRHASRPNPLLRTMFLVNIGIHRPVGSQTALLQAPCCGGWSALAQAPEQGRWRTGAQHCGRSRPEPGVPTHESLHHERESHRAKFAW